MSVKVQVLEKTESGDKWRYIVGQIGKSHLELTDDPEKGLPRNVQTLSMAQNIKAEFEQDFKDRKFRIYYGSGIDALYQVYLLKKLEEQTEVNRKANEPGADPLLAMYPNVVVLFHGFWKSSNTTEVDAGYVLLADLFVKRIEVQQADGVWVDLEHGDKAPYTRSMLRYMGTDGTQCLIADLAEIRKNRPDEKFRIKGISAGVIEAAGQLFGEPLVHDDQRILDWLAKNDH